MPTPRNPRPSGLTDLPHRDGSLHQVHVEKTSVTGVSDPYLDSVVDAAESGPEIALGIQRNLLAMQQGGMGGQEAV